MIQGAFPVLATPFTTKGEVDHESLRRLVAYVLEADADGVVFPGVASEFNFLTDVERTAALEVIAEAVAGKIPIIVGASAQSAETAGTLARQGGERGAAAAMVMAPASVGSDPAALRNFFARVGDRAGIPIMLQNAPVPVGSGLSVETILEAAAAVPAIRYVKEETLPSGQRITRLIEGRPASIESVFGGAGGRYIIDELNRGVAGTLPASELTEAHVAIVRAHAASNVAQARAIFNRILPLLNMQAIFRMRLTKAVLKSRGIFATEAVRDGSPELDAGDREELRIMLEEVEDLLNVVPPAPKTVLAAA